MTPYLTDSDVTLHQGDSLEVLRSMPDASVHMACTSPPFFGLRDYGTGTWEGGDEGCDHRHVTARSGCINCGARRIDSQIGLESSPDEWAARLVDVFREVRRVLRDDGTLWVECGDSYSQGHGGSSTEGNYTMRKAARGEADQPARGSHECSYCGWRTDSYTALVEHHKNESGHSTGAADYGRRGSVRNVMPGFKPKDLIGQPWLLAFALRADGWFLRSCIIWAKPNAMPESVTDRPTTGHSYVFLFSKRPRYFYDAEALREPVDWAYLQARTGGNANGRGWPEEMGGKGTSASGRTGKSTHVATNPAGRNARTVWTIPTEPNALAICRICDAYWQGGAPRKHCGEPVVQHFAAFPRELVRRMILAGTSERGVCGECGAPWVREVEKELEATRGKVGFHKGEGPRVDPYDAGSQWDFSGGVYGRYIVTTLGWHPSCECAAAVVPAIVCDPFSGSGTSLLVARSLGRRSVGIELSIPYCAMTRARLSQLSLLSELA